MAGSVAQIELFVTPLTSIPWDGSVGAQQGGAPKNATLVGSSSANVSNAAAVATLPGAAGRTTHVTAIMLTAGGATAAAQVIATITGLLGGTLSIPVGVQALATGANAPVILTFPGGLPAAAPNTALVLTLPALGAGNTGAAVSMFGFQI